MYKKLTSPKEHIFTTNIKFCLFPVMFISEKSHCTLMYINIMNLKEYIITPQLKRKILLVDRLSPAFLV